MIEDKQNSSTITKIKSNARKEISGVVTERDELALLWVASQGVMTVDQIHRAVYSRGVLKSPRITYTRVKFLEESRYLFAVHANHKKDRFFKATRQTLELLHLKNYCGVTRSLHVPSISEIPHAEVLTEIRIAIAKAGRHSNDSQWWRSEGSLLEDPNFPRQRFYDLLPDALWLTRSGKRIAIEFERTQKGITRIRKKVEGIEKELMRADRVFDLVLWVAVDGAYRDLKNALNNRGSQELRTVEQFLNELRENVNENG